MKGAWIVLAFGLSVASVADAQRSRWELDTSRSGMTDQPSVTLRLEAINPGPASTRDIRPALTVVCRGHAFEVYVSTGSVLRAEDDATPVRVRWGTGVAQATSWSRSPDHSVIFAPEPRPFLKQLLATPDLRLEVQPVDAVPKVITFDARGLDRHTKQLDAACPEREAEAGSADTVTIFLDPRDMAPSRDQVFMESGVDERPEVLSGPAMQYPDLLRQAGVTGRVLVQAIIDTTGRAEPASVKVVQSPNTGFDQPAINYVLGAQFRPARIHGRAVRVLVNLPIDFSIKKNSKRP
jgi:TonB family protein